MVVGGVTHRARAARARLEVAQLPLGLGEQRLLDEDVLAVGEQMLEHLHLGLVRHADEGRIVAVERDLANVAIVGFRRYGVDDGNHVIGGDAAALATLNAISRRLRHAYSIAVTPPHGVSDN